MAMLVCVMISYENYIGALRSIDQH